MPLDKSLKKVMVIGSGPIVIGQAAEFDYAGTQACRALREAGISVVLVNSNPATIMTDRSMADSIYIEPLTPDVVRRIIKQEKPDGLLSTLGGQTGLTLSMQLAREGFLEEHGVKLLGARLDTIEKAEDRRLFKDAMEKIGQPCIPSSVETTVEGSLAFAGEIGYPVIVRPAFTMGGTGGGIAEDPAQLREIAGNGLRLSPITQVLIEKCISGWKEIEFEVMRDARGNCITICSMENLDPVGVHTGDSIVIAPAVTLSTQEFSMLRGAALMIVDELQVEGGCNCQFAMHPTSREYAVIEVNPRVSRSSALASKATGYPIAKVATRIAVGLSLDEIPNEVTGATSACFEPAIDYVVVKFPKWPFDKFVYGQRRLGTQMKATGEVMSIAPSFENALMKAVRSAELGLSTPRMPRMAELSDEELLRQVAVCDDERLFAVYEALYRGVAVEKIHEITMIDVWFLYRLRALAELERRAAQEPITEDFYRELRAFGFPDAAIEKLSGRKAEYRLSPSFKMVDTCAGEFAAKTPYFYSVPGGSNDARAFIDAREGERPPVFVFGSGPIRIGQGIEFDYCSVHCAAALKDAGYAAVMLNNNPETVSTDFNTGDRLYFDPLTPQDVAAVAETERPVGAIVQFGGQTAIKLTRHLEKLGIPILGTAADSVDVAEDRERFDALLERLEIPRPRGTTVTTVEEALEAAKSLGYPVLLRPSYVLGGQNMIIAHSQGDVDEYMRIILRGGIENPILIDQYLMGTEVEVDAICDGEDFLIPGIMEHIERAGVHSGDSISVYPPQTLSRNIRDTIVEYTEKIAKALDVRGLVNIQYVVWRDGVYIIEVNPRSSRTVPYISKVTGIPMVQLATRIILGKVKLRDAGYGVGLFPEGDIVAVKAPVFSFEKLQDVDTQLGPEMKSTGEVLGVSHSFDEALLKALVGAGYRMKKAGGVLVSVRNSDKIEMVELVGRFASMGFDIYATGGTARALNSEMIGANTVNKIGEKEPDVMTLLESGKIDYVISTASQGRKPERDGVKIRRKAVERSIMCLTSLDTAKAVLDCLEMNRGMENMELYDITKL